MATFSFDVESTYDKAEMNNVEQQTLKEIATRYDFRGTPAAIEWLADKKGFKVIGENEWQVDVLVDMIGKQLAKRGMTSKVLDISGKLTEANMRAWKDVPFKDGLKQDDAKKITRLLKEKHPKVKTQIQGDVIRCTSSAKDELQAVQQTLRSEPFDFPIHFTNYR
jgi:uncharacterized protein YajQ (UPF0234 family)